MEVRSRDKAFSPAWFLVGAAFMFLASPASSGEIGGGNPAAGRSVFFNRCVRCHEPLNMLDMNQDERSRYDDSIPADSREISWRGPNLTDLIGRKSGTVQNYDYSPAMKAAGVIWSEATLKAFLLSPAGFVPGNKMRFNGLKREGEMENLIAYLGQHTAKAP